MAVGKECEVTGRVSDDEMITANVNYASLRKVVHTYGNV